MEVASKKMLPDLIKWVKVSGAAWAGNGFFYSRYPEPEKGRELSTKNENHRVMPSNVICVCGPVPSDFTTKRSLLPSTKRSKTIFVPSGE